MDEILPKFVATLTEEAVVTTLVPGALPYVYLLDAKNFTCLGCTLPYILY